MKKCFWAPGRVLFPCHESGFCQRKESAQRGPRAAALRTGKPPGDPRSAPGSRRAPARELSSSLKEVLEERSAEGSAMQTQLSSSEWQHSAPVNIVQGCTCKPAGVTADTSCTGSASVCDTEEQENLMGEVVSCRSQEELAVPTRTPSPWCSKGCCKTMAVLAASHPFLTKGGKRSVQEASLKACFHFLPRHGAVLKLKKNLGRFRL